MLYLECVTVRGGNVDAKEWRKQKTRSDGNGAMEKDGKYYMGR